MFLIEPLCFFSSIHLSFVHPISIESNEWTLFFNISLQDHRTLANQTHHTKIWDSGPLFPSRFLAGVGIGARQAINHIEPHTHTQTGAHPLSFAAALLERGVRADQLVQPAVLSDRQGRVLRLEQVVPGRWDECQLFCVSFAFWFGRGLLW